MKPNVQGWDRPSRAMAFALFAATLVAYWPALGGGFIWDDSGHVTRPELRSLAGLARIWFEPGATQQYYPVLHSAFWIESHLWGDAPFGYHLVTVLLHATAAVLFAGLLRRLRVPGAWLAALLFALHPVAVESVAWISEQKNTLSAVLYLCAALAYLRYDRERRPRAYTGATLLFLLAVGTKTVTATLPAALLVVLWWKRGRLEIRRDVGPLLPWFALALIAGAVTSWTERTLIGASGARFDLDPVQRILLAGHVIWFYLGKLLWPVDLLFVYPRWQIDPTDPWLYAYPLATGALLITCWRSRRRGLLAAALLFVGSLFPALGFVAVYPFIYSYVADHFQYLADLAIYALLGAGSVALLARLPRTGRVVVVAAVAAGLGTLTWRQSGMYRNVFTLYEATLAGNPGAWMAHNNLGIALVDAGRVQDAIPHYAAALKLRPDFAEAENNLGYALTLLNRPAEALPHLDRALSLQPTYAEAHNNRGIALMNLGRAAEGEAEFQTALRLEPDYPEAHLNAGLAFAHAGRTTEAIAQFAAAVRLRPDYAEAELNWAVGLTLSDQFIAASAHFQRAIELSPANPEARQLYGRALARSGNVEAAVIQYEKAIELNPRLGAAHLSLALALRQLGRNAEAAQELEEANRLGTETP
jgi:protein O-mannosyl-transferase